MDRMTRRFELVKRVKGNGDYKLPMRATKHSAGYDFVAPYDIVIKPQEQVMVMTGVKVNMYEDEFLMLVPRSSLGVKKGIVLANTIGIGDSDYCNNPTNEGEYGICLRNTQPAMSIVYEKTKEIVSNKPTLVDLMEANTVVIRKGERFAQGIIITYLEAYNCNSDFNRQGGFGSTNK